MSQNYINLEDFPHPRDRYCLEDCIGSGSLGNVFAAADLEASGKKVAIKVQKLNENSKPYIQQEYRVLRDLTSHANLPDFYGMYRKDGDIWFVMEVCGGGSVLDLVKGLLAGNRRMGEEHIAYILKEAVKAVTFLHEKCTIHRDIKAKNILLTKDGEVKLIDLGFSWSMQNALDKTHGCLGSPCWMAPEVISCRRTRQGYDNRVDVWSLGITAIELGDGKPPYQDMHPTRTLFQIVTNPPPTLNRIHNWSETFVDFINECLVKNPEHRPYISELLEHPFLNQIPENNYHLTLEMKTLLNDLKKLDLPKSEPEVAIIDNFLKCGFDGDPEPMLLEDLASLDHISEKNIMKMLEARADLEQHYTFVGDVLLALNPNENTEIFGETYHEKYRLKSHSENAPHIYTIADSAYQYALHHQIPQKILLSGESGSGKTRNYLHLINHLLYLGQNSTVNLERIKGAIKLIHSLTHASTTINSYSTRCLFKTTITYGSTGKVSGAIFNVYQLEKWRVSSVDMFQGNYHFLYYVYDGLCEMKKLEQYQLNPDRQYRYLRIDGWSKSSSPKYNVSTNLTKFKKILKIFEDFEIGEEERDTLFSIVAAILTIGEIRFQESDSGESIVENGATIEKISQLLKIDPDKFSWSLTNYCYMRKGTVVRKKSTVDEARDARDVLANNLYSRLVDYLVAFVNHKLSSGRAIFGEKYSVQVFDYFGFECVKTNHLPQLFINCFNEQLHYHYLQRLFSWEYLDINQEELEYQPFRYYDNKQTLDELLSKSEGLFSAIDEASKTGNGGKYVIDEIGNSEKKFVSVSGQSEFAVAHYTGRITYCATEMADKNRDFLPPEIVETLRLSDNYTVRTLFTNKLNRTGNLITSFDKEDEINRRRYKFNKEKSGTNQYSQIKRVRTSIHTFKALSLELLKELSIGSGFGGTHFVRCIRTKLKKDTENFDYPLVKQQIRALAVTETAKARQRGYPHRIPFQEFLRRYQFLAFDFDENVDVSKENCRLLLIRLKMEGWNIGKSKVFLKYYNEEYLARLYETQVKKIIKIQSILRRFLAKCLVAKQITDKERVYISKIGEQPKTQRMSEEEAATIIQKAYRESNIRKAYPDFAKDYKILDEETCNFIKAYADKWRRSSIFHVLVLYRAMRFQDTFNFSQQVHLYNIGVFYELQNLNQEISLEVVDSKAQVSNWLDEPKLPLRKIPFHLEDIPFYDTSGMCNLLTNPGVSVEKDETWDQPYRWRELVCSKESEPSENMTRNEEDLLHVAYNRDPDAPVEELPDLEFSEEETKPVVKIVVEEFVSKEEKEEENQATREKKSEEAGDKKEEEEVINVLEKSFERNTEFKDEMTDDSLIPSSPKKEEMKEEKINSATKLANKDFEYIKHPVVIKPRSVDPVAELRQLGQKNASEDDPPFNFQGMLKKTNYRKEPLRQEDDKPVYSLKKRQLKSIGDDNKGITSEEKSINEPVKETKSIPNNNTEMKNKEIRKVDANIKDEETVRDIVTTEMKNKEARKVDENIKDKEMVTNEEKGGKEVESSENEKNKKNKLEKQYSFEKMNGFIEDSDLSGNKVIFELAPGIIIEGIEVEL